MPLVRNTMKRSTQGAVLVEAIIILPLVAWLIIACIQLLWLFWAQHTLYNTSHYVLRAGQIQHGNMLKMTSVLASGMASTQIQWDDSEANLSEETLRENTMAATVNSLVHAKLASKIIVHSPTAVAIQKFNEQRYDLKMKRWVDEIAIDHAAERVIQSNDKQAWLTARQLDIEIWWCLPLEIPFVAVALQSWRQLFESESQRFCRMRETIIGKPLWPLIARRKGPMMSGFRVSD